MSEDIIYDFITKLSNISDGKVIVAAADLKTATELVVSLRAERDELRALLREARSPIATLAQFNKEDPHIYEHDGVRMALVHYDVVSAASATASETLARIDRALKGNGDE